MKMALSPMRQKILDYIRRFTAEQGYPPSVREICDGVGLKSPSTVHCHLNTLRAGGYLEKDDRKTRTVKLAGSSAAPGMRGVPILGTVTAGIPILAVEEIVGYVPFDCRGGEHFGLKVRGDSMIGAGILDGDVVVVKKSDVAQHGDIVVALIGEEATVKRLYKKDGEVLFMPENPLYEPIDGGEMPCILGTVAAVYRTY